VSAALFGSAARRDGDIESDIEIILIHPGMSSRERERLWAPQVHQLRNEVWGWTGNHLQVLDWSASSLLRYKGRREKLIGEFMHDGITLYGTSIRHLIESPQ
jgi:predicted nucleotidyltransferase